MKKLAIIALALVLSASTAWAVRGGKGGGPGGPGGPGSPCEMGMGMGMTGMDEGKGMGECRGIDRMAAQLNLTDQQKKQMKEKQQAFRAEMKPLRDELFTKREELRQLWAKPDPDQAQINAKQAEIRDIHAQMQDKMTQQRLGFRQMLTPEQREKLAAFQSERGQRGHGRHRGHGKGMGHGHGHGQGGPGMGQGQGQGMGQGQGQGMGQGQGQGQGKSL